MNQPVLYILERTDLPSLNNGKGHAQSCHAANMAVKCARMEADSGNLHMRDLLEAWEAEGAYFGTTITLSVPTGEQLNSVVNFLAPMKSEILSGVAVDDEYPYSVPAEILPLIDPANHTVEPVVIAGTAYCCRKEFAAGFVFAEKDRVWPILHSFKLVD